MKAENKDYLMRNRPIYDKLLNAVHMEGVASQLKNFDIPAMLKVMHEEFTPGYPVDLTSVPSVHQMILNLYTHYDRIIEQELFDSRY